MRNDARPIGEHSPASPVGGDAKARADAEPGRRPPSPATRSSGERPAEDRDSRESVTHDRQSHVVHPDTDRDAD